MIEEIIKRNGKIVPFDPEKITNAIRGAVMGVGGTDLDKRPAYLTKCIIERVEYNRIKGERPEVEEIQDAVEKTLIEKGHAQVAKAFILYRESHKNSRDRKLTMDTIDKIEEYLNKKDWMVNGNANMTFSLQGLNNNLVEEQSKNYWLHRVYPERIRKAHERTDIHMHDLGVIGAYCVGWDLEDILTKGITGVEGKVEAGPAKHLRSALGQLVNFFYTLQGETAGAQAFSNFDTYLAPFIKKDEMDYKEVKQCMQEFLFNVNVPTRVGFQTPFTNVTMDLKVPEHMKDKPVVIGLNKEKIEKKYEKIIGIVKEQVNNFRQFPLNKSINNKFLELFNGTIKEESLEKKCLELSMNAPSSLKEKREYLAEGILNIVKEKRDNLIKLSESTYGTFQKEMDMFNRAFAECMIEGDAKGRLFTFPIPTYNITKDFDWDNPEHKPLWEMTAKYGIPYFSNFINSDMKPEDSRSMCCRLRLDNKQLIKRGGGLFGSNPLTGSIGVVTINLPRIAYKSQNKEVFFKYLGDLMDLSKESLQIKRKTLETFADANLYPYAKFYLRNVKKRFNEYWKNHFGTIGILGMNEAIMNFMPEENIATEKGKSFALEVMDFMRGKIQEYQEKTNEMYNLEATPGESTTYRFADADKKRFKKIIVANEEAVKKGANPFYTNSTHLPVNYTDDIFEALKLQDELQTKYTGGTVFHAFVGERLNAENVKTLVRKIAENFRLPYFTITPTFSVCGNHGYLEGDKEFCPKCEVEGKETIPERYSRVVGYIRPLNQWNKGKKSEWNERKMFNIK